METFRTQSRPARRSRTWPRRLVAGVLLLVAVFGGGGAAFFAIPQQELPEAAAAQASTAEVSFQLEEGQLTFRPTGREATTGLILYPGGKVSAGAYAPLAQAIAAKGYLVAIVPMPLNLAVLGIDRAAGVIDAHPDVRAWAIGGHSLGGAMAAQYAAGDGRVRGLALWAAYSPIDLSDRDLVAVVVSGSLDSGLPEFVSPERLANLPPNATVVVIDGGNHEQIGWYVGQPNDPPATISRPAQQDRVVEATVDLLRRMDAGVGSPEAGRTGRDPDVTTSR